MSKELVLPDHPSEYKNFAGLSTRVERLRKLPYFTLPGEIYRDSLVAYCQLMDRFDQGGLLQILQRKVASARNDSSERQDMKDDYFAQLHQISAYPQLQKAIKSEAAQRRYGYGLNGGPRTKFVSESVKPYFDVLSEVDPRVTNWVAMYEIGIGGDDFSKIMSLRYLMGAFAAEGMPLNSPEAKLALLTQLENRAKIHMIGPVLRPMTRLLDPAISFGALGERSSIVKYNRLNRLLSGDMKLSKGRPGSIVDEARSGTEYYRGYYNFIHGRKEDLANAHSGEDAPALLKAIQTVIFAQVSKRRKGQTATQIWRQLAKPLAEGDYTGVRNEAAALVRENPELFPEYVWHEFGLDNNEVKRNYSQKLREKEMQIQEAAVASAMRPQMLLDKAKAERNNPALRSQVEPYVGQEVKLNGDTAIVRKISQVKERGGTGYTEMVQILYPGGRSAMISFQNFLDRLQNPQ